MYDQFEQSTCHNGMSNGAANTAEDGQLDDNDGVFVFDNRTLKWNMMFSSPCLHSNFFVLLNEKKTVLEHVNTTDKWILGVVRVVNISFEKRVFVRYSIDKWLTYKEVKAEYLDNSNDGLTDRFSFNFSLEDNVFKEALNYSTTSTNGRLFSLEFAIRFESHHKVHWDNNNSHNYVIDCYNFEKKDDSRSENS